MDHVIYLKLRKKKNACKVEQIHKMTTIFIQNGNLTAILDHF